MNSRRGVKCVCVGEIAFVVVVGAGFTESAAARRVFIVGVGGAPTSRGQRRRRQQNVGGGGGDRRRHLNVQPLPSHMTL